MHVQVVDRLRLGRCVQNQWLQGSLVCAHDVPDDGTGL